jgi:hypothetical protein
MYYLAELVLKSYVPLSLEKGMWFVQKLNHGHKIKEQVEVFALKDVPQNMEDFLTKNGYPVEPYIINADDEVLASPEQIGWFDEGEHADELHDITLKEINTVLNDFDGEIEIEMDWFGHNSDEFDYPEDKLMTLLYEEKVTLRYPEYEEEEEDEYITNQDVWENGEIKLSRPYPHEADVVEHLVLLDDDLFYIHTDLDNNLKNPDDDAQAIDDDENQRVSLW